MRKNRNLKRINFYMPVEDIKFLSDYAEGCITTISEEIRKAVKKHIESLKEKQRESRRY